MYKLIPFRSTVDSIFPSVWNDHFMREFFDVGAPTMRVDVRERDNAYLIEADLPGVKKEQINISAENGVLTVAADIGSEKKEQKQGYVFSERRTGHVERSFNLEGIDESGIKADYENGVLRVLLPKLKAEEKKAAKIEIGDKIDRLTDGE